MSYIESTKSYAGSELDTIFFRPMLAGDAAETLGVKVMYNMPVPTTLSVFKGSSNILATNDGSGWDGSSSTKSQVKVDLQRVKAEMSYAASDYYSMVFDNLSTKLSIDEEDLSGSALETAETEIFKRSIYDSLRATAWFGDTDNSSLNTFDGLMKDLMEDYDSDSDNFYAFTTTALATASTAVTIFDKCWDQASSTLRDLKEDGQLVYYVDSKVYNTYEKYLDSIGNSASYVETVSGRQKLYYHGIEIYNIGLEELFDDNYPSENFVFLTDRRNLVLAINTSDFPGSEVRMWYNPDEMENRQRATFAAGARVIDKSIVSAALNLVSES